MSAHDEEIEENIERAITYLRCHLEKILSHDEHDRGVPQVIQDSLTYLAELQRAGVSGHKGRLSQRNNGLWGAIERAHSVKYDKRSSLEELL
jgi:hypothetical protein